MGEDKRFYRYTANLIRIIAADKKIDVESVAGFSKEVEQAYKSPWKAKTNSYGNENGEEIVNNLLKGGENA